MRTFCEGAANHANYEKVTGWFVCFACLAVCRLLSSLPPELPRRAREQLALQP